MKKSVRITYADVYLKPVLIRVVHAAVKVIEQPYYRVKYDRTLKRRGKKWAIIAISRMILTAFYFMFNNSEIFNSSDL